MRPHLATTAQRLAVYGLGRLPLGADGRSEVVKVLGRAKLHFISKQFKGLQLRSLSKHISTRLPTRQAAEAERQPVDRCNTCALAARNQEAMCLRCRIQLMTAQKAYSAYFLGAHVSAWSLQFDFSRTCRASPCPKPLAARMAVFFVPWPIFRTKAIRLS